MTQLIGGGTLTPCYLNNRKSRASSSSPGSRLVRRPWNMLSRVCEEVGWSWDLSWRKGANLFVPIFCIPDIIVSQFLANPPDPSIALLC